MYHHGGKEIPLDDEQENPFVGVEENLAVFEEIHLFELQEISFLGKLKVFGEEKHPSAALILLSQCQY